MELFVKVLIAYLLGGILGGDIMRRLSGGGSLRDSGSGNVGATNALRTRGWKFAVGVLAIDIGKGVLAVTALAGLRGPFGWAAASSWLPFACGTAVTLGHCYPPLAGFRGGKGVATAAGVTAALLPAALPWMLGAFVVILMLSGYASLASLGGAVAVAFWVACIGASGVWSPAGAFAVALLALLVFKHRDNLMRLRAGTESRFERVRLLGRLLERLGGRRAH